VNDRDIISTARAGGPTRKPFLTDYKEVAFVEPRRS
jgi:hypothetical protein